MRYTLTTLFATAVLAALAAQAGDIYRWKDAAGTWHYADQPVPGAERLSTASRQTAPSDDAIPAESPPKAKPAAATASPNAPSGQVAQRVKQDVAAARAEHCKKATEDYELAISARRLYKAGPNGEQQFLDEDQMEAHRVAARSEMENLCGK